MTDSLYLAWRYLRHHRAKTLLLVASLAVFIGLPGVMRAMSAVISESLMARAESTPLLLGKKGSSLDLVIDALYFEPKDIDALTMADTRAVRATGFANALPLRTGLTARRSPVVGTDLDYFGFRDLRVADGRHFATLGECVLGAEAASTLGLRVGDALLTSPAALFDLAGVYPLKLAVVGILEPARTPDDRAVFVDLRTAWIAEGLGHGHQDLRAARADVLLQSPDGVTTANAKLVQYNEITDDNVDSFHFHGDPGSYPVSAIIAVPSDDRAGVLLQGRYVDDETRQILRPARVVQGLNARIFRFERVLQVLVSTVGVATALMFVLVMVLSWRLRAEELRTMTRLGCSRFKAVQIMGAELVLMVGASVVLAGVLGIVLTYYGETWLRGIILQGS